MKLTATILLTIAAAATCRAGSATFTEKEVTVENRDAGITLAGTLTVPAGSAPEAAIVLANGSGQQNRDEEIAGHKPFKVLAEYLSSNGYAVLRLDDRGEGGSSGDFTKATTDDFVSDISSAVNWIDSCFNRIDTGVIGHSEGGTVALKTSIKNKNCRFIITLAAPAWAGDSLIMSQSRTLATAMTGQWEGEALQRRLLDIAKSDMPPYLANASMLMVLKEALGDAASMPGVTEQLAKQTSAMLTPWYRAMLRYNPADDIARVEVPWLALNGDRDTQVLPQSLETISMLNKNAETVTLTGHNHLFQNCSTGLPNEYASISEDISEQTLRTIVEWLKRTTATF